MVRSELISNIIPKDSNNAKVRASIDCESYSTEGEIGTSNPTPLWIDDCYIAFLRQLDDYFYEGNKLTSDYSYFYQLDESYDYLASTEAVVFDSKGRLIVYNPNFSKEVWRWFLDQFVISTPEYMDKPSVQMKEFPGGSFFIGEHMLGKFFDVNACSKCDGFIPIETLESVRSIIEPHYYEGIKKNSHIENLKHYLKMDQHLYIYSFPKICPYCREELQIVKRKAQYALVEYDGIRSELDGQKIYGISAQQSIDLIPVLYRGQPLWVTIYDGPDSGLFLRKFTYNFNRMGEKSAKGIGPVNMFFSKHSQIDGIKANLANKWQFIY